MGGIYAGFASTDPNAKNLYAAQPGQYSGSNYGTASNSNTSSTPADPYRLLKGTSLGAAGSAPTGPASQGGGFGAPVSSKGSSGGSTGSPNSSYDAAMKALQDAIGKMNEPITPPPSVTSPVATGMAIPQAGTPTPAQPPIVIGAPQQAAPQQTDPGNGWIEMNAPGALNPQLGTRLSSNANPLAALRAQALAY